MRRKDKEITEISQIIRIMEHCDVCRLGLSEDGLAYVVPMNFGFRQKDGTFTLYFHSAAQGRKLDLLRNNKKAGFEMDTAHKLLTDSCACEFSMEYLSIIGSGSVRMVEDMEEKKEILREIVRHYSAEEPPMSEASVRHTAVFCLEVEQLSAKGTAVL